MRRQTIEHVLWGGAGLAFTTATLHLMGIAYHAGYIGVWSLPHTFMRPTHEGLLERAAYAWMHMGPFMFQVFVVLSLVLLGSPIVVVVAARLATQSRLLAQLGSYFAKPTPLAPVRSSVSPVMKRFGMYFALAACVVFAGLGILYVSSRAGKAQGVREATCSDCAKSQLTMRGNESVYGRLIACSDRHCVVQTADTVMVLRLEDIVQIKNPVVSALPELGALR